VGTFEKGRAVFGTSSPQMKAGRQPNGRKEWTSLCASSWKEWIWRSTSVNSSSKWVWYDRSSPDECQVGWSEENPKSEAVRATSRERSAVVSTQKCSVTGRTINRRAPLREGTAASQLDYPERWPVSERKGCETWLSRLCKISEHPSKRIHLIACKSAGNAAWLSEPLPPLNR